MAKLFLSTYQTYIYANHVLWGPPIRKRDGLNTAEKQLSAAFHTRLGEEYHDKRIRSRGADIIVNEIPIPDPIRQKAKIWRQESKQLKLFDFPPCKSQLLSHKGCRKVYHNRKCKEGCIKHLGESGVNEYRLPFCKLDNQVFFLTFCQMCVWPDPAQSVGDYVSEDRRFRYPQAAKYRIKYRNGREILVCLTMLCHIFGRGPDFFKNMTSQAWEAELAHDRFPTFHENRGGKPYAYKVDR